MKINIICTIIGLFLIGLSMQAESMEITVLDEVGHPVSGAVVDMIYDNPSSLNRYDEQEEFTNRKGVAKFSVEGPLGASLTVEKEGYYGFGIRPSKDFRFTPGQLSELSEFEIVLRRKVAPSQLYAQYGGGGKIPAEGKWVGYDLKIGDWVEPYGIGEISDILFRYKNDFKGIYIPPYTDATVESRRRNIKGKYERLGREFSEEAFRLEAGMWDAVLEIAFPGKKEGLVRVEKEFNPHSVLRMPHQAPEKGYSPTYRYDVKSYESSKLRNDVGIFLRTRVVLDEHGDIQSANYTKIHGDFRFLARGEVGFDYYFNPRPNDRNLEFDPKQNLFSEEEPGSNVYRP